LASSLVEGAKVFEGNPRWCGRSSALEGFLARLGDKGLDIGYRERFIDFSGKGALNRGLGRLKQIIEVRDDSFETVRDRVNALTLRLLQLLENGIVPVHVASNSRPFNIIATNVTSSQAIDFVCDP